MHDETKWGLLCCDHSVGGSSQREKGSTDIVYMCTTGLELWSAKNNMKETTNHSNVGD